ncbi:hypothetical protein GCM10010916_25570 [Paenibacillus abyssi]|uniref:Uncharacterized protein n=1 Tax=Paenibacillus abyssi TaxID=1340531 RepID=A0A917FWA2_9BACL|nr:hypothetical protein GCM10010916_25570 [Paenibacillus abyssi]
MAITYELHEFKNLLQDLADGFPILKSVITDYNITESEAIHIFLDYALARRAATGQCNISLENGTFTFLSMFGWTRHSKFYEVFLIND